MKINLMWLEGHIISVADLYLVCFAFKVVYEITNDILTNRLRLGYSCCNRSLV